MSNSPINSARATPASHRYRRKSDKRESCDVEMRPYRISDSYSLVLLIIGGTGINSTRQMFEHEDLEFGET